VPLPSTSPFLSTHGFGLAETIELARKMGYLPGKCVVFAVEGASFEAGRPLSGPARSAARGVAARIRHELGEQIQEP
jgi:hydrogenase maturation protease